MTHKMPHTKSSGRCGLPCSGESVQSTALLGMLFILMSLCFLFLPKINVSKDFCCFQFQAFCKLWSQTIMPQGYLRSSDSQMSLSLFPEKPLHCASTIMEKQQNLALELRRTMTILVFQPYSQPKKTSTELPISQISCFIHERDDVRSVPQHLWVVIDAD